MAEQLPCELPRTIRTLDISVAASVDQIRSAILNLEEPCLLPGASSDWACSSWTPEYLARKLGDCQTTFRICAKMDSPYYKFERHKVVMETDCDYARASFKNYCAWLANDLSNAGELQKYPRAHFWCYADYKYMADLFKEFPMLRKAPEWGKLGFPEVSGDQSTIWIGSECTTTPCHIDSYGCNLVAQIHGKKRWQLFSPSETRKLYPTRIPYEESSIFSQVNIKYPDLHKTPEYRTAVKYQVDLKPGDVLLVPRHWWHYVEALEASISINTWINLESDDVDRVREALTRTLVHSMKSAEGEIPQKWLNPTEQSGSHAQHLEYIQNAVNMAIAQEKQKRGETFERNGCLITNNDVIDCITSPQIVSAIADELLQKGRAKQQHTCSKGCSRPTSPSKRELLVDVSNHKEPSHSACNCKCCLSDNNRQRMMTRHTKRNNEQNTCLSCCKNSPQKKKKHNH